MRDQYGCPSQALIELLHDLCWTISVILHPDTFLPKKVTSPPPKGDQKYWSVYLVGDIPIVCGGSIPLDS